MEVEFIKRVSILARSFPGITNGRPLLPCHFVQKNYCFSSNNDYLYTMVAHKVQLSDFVNKFRLIAIILSLSVWSSTVSAQVKPTLDAINFSVFSGDRVRIELKLSDPVEEPKSFAIHKPARIALDLPGVHLNLPHKTQIINVGHTYSVTAVESKNRTRVIIQLIRFVPYKMDIMGRSIFITIGRSGDTGSLGYPKGAEMSQIEDIIFEKGESGEGRVYVVLSDPSPVINMREENERIVIDFLNTNLPERLDRILDVTDFATPILTIDASPRGMQTHMIINTTGGYEYLTYQTNNLQTIDIKQHELTK